MRWFCGRKQKVERNGAIAYAIVNGDGLDGAVLRVSREAATKEVEAYQAIERGIFEGSGVDVGGRWRVVPVKVRNCM